MSTFVPAADRYESVEYRRCGRSGLRLPAISLGLWNNFGDDRPFEVQRAIVRRAFDRGVTHFDLANNYGPPYGSAERNFGRILGEDLRPFRDEIVIATKAGWDMWPGPYGDLGSRKYLLASLDQSLTRLGVDYVDIYYHHRPDPDTPLEESLGALDTAVRSGKALYAGISAYSSSDTERAARVLRQMGTPLLIHQPNYSMINRFVERRLLDVAEEEGIGVIAFSPLAQGLLTDRYRDGVPEDSRGAQGTTLFPTLLGAELLGHIAELRDLAGRRGQRLSQMALAWALRDPRVTSVIVGVSSLAQLDENLDALDNPTFDEEELAAIDASAKTGGIPLSAEFPAD